MSNEVVIKVEKEVVETPTRTDIPPWASLPMCGTVIAVCVWKMVQAMSDKKKLKSESQKKQAMMWFYIALSFALVFGGLAVYVVVVDM